MLNVGLSPSFSLRERTSCVAAVLVKMLRRRKFLRAKSHSFSQRLGRSETAVAAAAAGGCGRPELRSSVKALVWRSNKSLAGGEVGGRARAPLPHKRSFKEAETFNQSAITHLRPLHLNFDIRRSQCCCLRPPTSRPPTPPILPEGLLIKTSNRKSNPHPLFSKALPVAPL